MQYLLPGAQSLLPSARYIIYYINGRRLLVTEVRDLYGCLSCGWLGGVCMWRHTLRWELGVAGWARSLHGKQLGRNGRCAPTAGFLVLSNRGNYCHHQPSIAILQCTKQWTDGVIHCHCVCHATRPIQHNSCLIHHQQVSSWLTRLCLC